MPKQKTKEVELSPEDKKELKEAKDDIRSNRFATAKEIKEILDVITITADIHPDGDVYVKIGKQFKYLGRIGESDCGSVPDKYYLQIKEWLKKI